MAVASVPAGPPKPSRSALLSLWRTREVERDAGQQRRPARTVKVPRREPSSLVADRRDVEAGGVAPMVGRARDAPCRCRRTRARRRRGCRTSRPRCARDAVKRALAAARDDVDDAAHGVGAVEAAHGAADHLDALDVLGGEVGEVELAVGGVVGLDAVDQDQRVVALGAADAHLREIAEAAAAADGDAGQAAQGLGGVPDLLARAAPRR